MKTAGMFVELSQGLYPEPGLSIHDNIAPEPLPDADRVVAYLRAGHDLVDIMDVERDPLDPSRTVMNGSVILTDGDYYWRYDYQYYVRRYNVVVPAEFLALMRERHYIVPDLPYETLSGLAEQAEKYAFGPNGGVPFPGAS